MRWKPCFDGDYEVSDCGDVRRARPGRGTYAGRPLKPVLMGMGYYVVNPVRNGKNVYTYIHVLVAAAFIGDRPDGMDINHIDGNKLNNHVSNLEYVTHRENMAHARRLSLISDAKTYSDALVAKVRELAARGKKSPEIAKETGISARHCRDIINNKLRKQPCQS